MGGFWRRRILDLLDDLHGGTLVVRDVHGTTLLGHADGDAPLCATLTVHDEAFYRRVALGGSVGAGEAYFDGLWDCDDLVSLVRLLVRNRERLDAMESGFARFAGWLLRGWHALRPNSRRGGSRRNISAHYDLGNPLFELFLSPDMMYSSAIFASADETLEQASLRKLETICARLQLQPGDHVLEIGTGWGGFAIHAATRHGCRVTTTTLSAEQRDFAQSRVAAAGLSDRITVLLDDYRDLGGQYDKVVSIEMVEAVGAAQLPTYFAQLSGLLKPDGLALVQAITIEDHRYRRALREVDFIKRHVFPGSFIPSTSAMLGAMAGHSDLGLLHLQEIGDSYALTLREWRRRFEDAHDQVRALGYDERFLRLWRFYLCYCEGGFLERSIGDVQMLFARPGYRCRIE
ncbi:cyclopropane-fatty-acyl-phospholipid synthase family protein [Luteimonas vadosa]|uniref:Cyclopropane-fatty-acyl-phospholipid synthase family protein n=1 Tax=Luteimonas vadosa TaxID=1165507 RepID=A0ABP9E6X0_9GAMM